MKHLLIFLLLLSSLSTFATTTISSQIDNYFQNNSEETLCEECEEYCYYDENNSALVDSMEKEFKNSLQAIQSSTLPFDVQYTLRKYFIDKSFSGNSYTTFYYQSEDGEYGYEYELTRTYLVSTDNYLIVYEGFGGEWGRESANYDYLIVNSSGTIILSNTKEKVLYY